MQASQEGSARPWAWYRGWVRSTMLWNWPRCQCFATKCHPVSHLGGGQPWARREPGLRLVPGLPPSQARHPPCIVLEYRQGSLTSIMCALLWGCFTQKPQSTAPCQGGRGAVPVMAAHSQLAMALGSILVPCLHPPPTRQYSRLFTPGSPSLAAASNPAWLQLLVEQ